MKAFILAGGEGTRLRPVTLETPKPLITVQRKPILTHLIELYKRHGIEDFLVSINQKHEDDFSFWKERYHPQENIEFIIEDEPLGTFGALMLAKDKLGDEPFFMSNGDELKDFDLGKMRDFHNSENSIATVGLVDVSDPRQYGVAVVEGGKIKKFIEKPEEPPSSHINSGLYLLTPEIFSRYPHDALVFSMIEKDLFPQLADAGALHGFHLKGQWYDCGTFERWEKAIKEWYTEDN